MPNQYNSDVANDKNADDMKYQGKLQSNSSGNKEYLGKQKRTSGGDIGLSGKNGSKDVGLTPDSKGLEKGTTMGKREYS